jgi:hypothetical protein
MPGRPVEHRDLVALRNARLRTAVQIGVACLVGALVACLAVSLPSFR